MTKCLPKISETNVTYSDISRSITAIAQAYQSYHPIVTLILIVSSVCLGIVNLIILNFKKMVSPTNRMLSCIGLIDMVMMCTYAPFVIYFHIFYKCDLIDGTENLLPSQLLFSYIILTAVCHCASIWLAIGLSALRLHCMKHPQQPESLTWKQMYVITATVLTMAASTSIIYVINTKIDVTNDTSPAHNNVTVHRFSLIQSGLALFLFQGIVVKLLPSVLLTIMVCFIIKEFRSFVKRRRQLGKSGGVNNTTRMLIGIVILFILLEMPQGIVIFISAVSATFFKEIYSVLGDFLDLMTIVRTVANFFIYCSMSAMFRRYLVEILCRISSCSTSELEREVHALQTMLPKQRASQRLKTKLNNCDDTESELEYHRNKDLINLLPVPTEAII